MIDFVVVVGYC